LGHQNRTVQGTEQYLQVIKFLLESGSDPLKATRSSTNRALLTPLDYAVNNMDSEVPLSLSPPCIIYYRGGNVATHPFVVNYGGCNIHVVQS